MHSKRMALKTTEPRDRAQKHDQLVCPECGNIGRFIEVMELETHLVDGSRNYIRCLDAVVGNYHCAECGTSVEQTDPARK